MPYDREAYFNSVRASLFSGSLEQVQVDGQTVILAVWEYQAAAAATSDERWLAYMLATVFHETAGRMWPITEYGSQSYLEGKEYYPYVGRGFVQLTWESNYEKASNLLSLTDERDLVAHPDMALDSLIATRVLFRGMAEGWFTGRALGDYFNDDEDDPVNARAIVNADVSKNGKMIAGYHDRFLDALEASRLPDAPIPVPAVEWLNVALTRSSPNVRVSITLDGETVLAAAG
jgi:hypothetical protein